ncbi:hypothetical protein T265_07817 [Opisthorchis viverrini]|uniref:Uncharacterized protein n=1 Tax=Opisthorchis viverrini TaxID=6198 RepID=A0A075AAF4_OPIVI|nr:hypothetical protein T265_07817 [Opisthorchis viverrini]KER24549.1 hypothetical protein T265_07817 [Opisthorchis viverrini]
MDTCRLTGVIHTQPVIADKRSQFPQFGDNRFVSHEDGFWTRLIFNVDYQFACTSGRKSPETAGPRGCLVRTSTVLIININSMMSGFKTDASLPYNHDLFENPIVKKRIKLDGEGT